MKSVSRLIGLFKPEHYTLSLNLEREKRHFSGTVTINGESQQGANEIRLHSKDLKIISATIDGKSANTKHEDHDELVIEHPDITEGKHVVTVTFEGTITDDMNGIYPCYYEIDGKKAELLATQFESHYARQAFPCIDEPEAKATFDLTITTETEITVLGNMPVKNQKIESDLLVTTFDTTPIMSTYLLAWVAGDMQSKTAQTSTGVEVSVWSTRAHSEESLDFALDIATRTIEYFDDYFGVPYPLPKSDHVALPDFSAGAMENWGLITYREIALLVDPKTTTLSTKQYAATVITHELSHQWFGNLVTMEWWNDLWLNESFANMMEYVAVDALEPSWNIWLDFATSEVVSSLRRDSLDGVQSIQIDVNHPDEISTIFDPSIVYAKGGRLLRMLQAYVGTEDFQKGLKLYFEAHKYTNTKAEDLWRCLSEASGKDISLFMNSWMTQPGFPVVTANIDGNNIELSQKQFFIGPHEDKGRSWPVPLHGASESIPETLVSESISFTYNDKTPFRLNSNGTAHFITKYDDKLRADIIKSLHDMSSVDKINFLHEQLLLAKAGLQSHAAMIPLLIQLKEETNESVWSIISLAINELKRFVESDSPEESKLKDLVAEVASIQYKRLGWVAAADEDENDTKLRSTIIGLSLFAGVPSATKEAGRLFEGSSVEDLDPELRTAVMAHAVRSESPKGVLESLVEKYPTVTNSELRDDIAAALTSTKSQEAHSLLANKLKDSSFVRPQDFTHWFVWLLRNRYSRDFMWQWTRDNWDWIKKTFSGDSHYDMLPRYIAGSLISRKHLTELEEFFKPLELEVSLRRNIQIGYTELKGIVELLENDSENVRSALLGM